MSKKNMSSSEQVTYCEKYMKDAKRDRTERSVFSMNPQLVLSKVVLACTLLLPARVVLSPIY